MPKSLLQSKKAKKRRVYMAKRWAEKAGRGECRDCKNSAKSTSILCQACTDKAVANQRRRSAARAGVCSQCLVAKPPKGRKICLECTKTKRLWRERNKDRIRERHLRRVHNMSIDEYEDMLSDQGGACAICRQKTGERLHVDHCHTTDIRRGLLCGSCNIGLGMFRDNSDYLMSAAQYIDR